jgi:hypothetical protein
MELNALRRTSWQVTSLSAAERLNGLMTSTTASHEFQRILTQEPENQRAHWSQVLKPNQKYCSLLICRVGHGFAVEAGEFGELDHVHAART